jgi:polyketide synthase PksN
LVYRSGEWYRAQLVPCELPEYNGDLYRKGGVYVVIGGAGGLGEVFTEHLIRKYQARMIWIGRRAADSAIQAKIARLANFGPAPMYIPADAGNRGALELAFRAIKTQYGRIDGVVHAAITLRDKRLAQMDEVDFVASLSAKVDVSVRLAQVLAAEPVDFVLFFSSLQSFVKMPSQGNYAAGCTFKDAFALRLGQQISSPVKIINWGYWGSVGIVASQTYRSRMAQLGVDSIEPEEGIAALSSLMSAPVPQLAFFKTQQRPSSESHVVVEPDETDLALEHQ